MLSIQPMIFKQFFKKGSMLIRVVIFSKKNPFTTSFAHQMEYFSLGEKG